MTYEIRQPHGQPTGGEFANHNRTESDTTLGQPAPQTIHLPIVSGVSIPTFENSELPPFPEGVGKPAVSFVDGDDTDSIYVTIEGDDYSLTVWQDDEGSWQDSVNGWDEPTGLTPGQDEALLRWARVVGLRVEHGARAVQSAAFTGAACDTIVAAALGRNRQDVAAIAQSSPTGNASTDESGRARAEAIIKAFSANDDPEASVSDILTDLMHYARAEDLDFDDMLRSAQSNADAEFADGQA